MSSLSDTSSVSSSSRLSSGSIESSSTSSNFVKVGVRIVPTASNESCLEVADGIGRASVSVNALGSKRAYTFDRAFDSSEPQTSMFAFVAPAIMRVLDGETISIVTLGPSATGKTHTVFGTKTDQGLLPRIAHALLQKTPLRLSMFQIYEDKVYDLLENHTTAIRHSQQEKFDIRAVSKQEVASVGEFEAYISTAVSHRRTAATQINQNSSRSHAFITLETSDGGRMILVDLAGGERLKMVAGKGHNTKESIATNTSLSSVYKVLDQLAAGRGHVSHRETVLTMALNPVWSESSRLFVITCVSGDPSRAGETRFSLKYARRAREIKLGPNTPDSKPRSLSRLFSDDSLSPSPASLSRGSLFSPDKSNLSDQSKELRPLYLLSPTKQSLSSKGKKRVEFRKLEPASAELNDYRQSFLEARYSPVYIDDDGAVVYDERRLNPSKNRDDASLLGYIAHFANHSMPSYTEDPEELYTAWLLSNAKPRQQTNYRSLGLSVLVWVILIFYLYWDHREIIHESLELLKDMEVPDWTTSYLMGVTETHHDSLQPLKTGMAYTLATWQAVWAQVLRVWAYFLKRYQVLANAALARTEI